MIEGIIFDLDGVLTCTDQYHYKAWKKIADQENIYFDEKINNLLRGVSRMESLNIILKNGTKTYTEDEKQRLAEQKNDLYKTFLQELTPADVTDDVRNTLKKLKEKKIALAVGSSSKNTHLILEKTALLNFFDVIVDGNQITHSKPDPEVFLKAAMQLHLPVDKCLVIEDAKPGIDAAVSGGFACCGIGDASHYSLTTYPIGHLQDILLWVDK